MPFDWRNYQCADAYDELFAAPGVPRHGAENLVGYLQSLSPKDLADRRLAAELAIKVMGITFTVYSEGKNVDRAWPFDIIPRVIPRAEWEKTERGLKQRVTALNHFIQDLYGKQKIVKDGVFPAEILAESVNFRKQCIGVTPPRSVWAHICGSDLVRDRDGTIYVLEDNLRVPSGVSYMLENRMVIKRIWPEVFQTTNILPVDDYPAQLYDMLAGLSPRPGDTPSIAILTPGIFNSAYFEHAYLAQQMGVDLVEGSDLFVDSDDCVYKKTIYGPKRVDVIYRRIDDLFLDPDVFNPESILGVKGLMRAWIKGKVGLANAPGAGVADDKVVYAYVPQMIKYYLVVKSANESGGYGMLIGPRASKEEHEKFRGLIKKNPRNYMAQPTLSLSTGPTITDDGIEPRHLDLRPFILSRGDSTYVTTGGLTRVALVKGSLVVNSSQGGGSKDTWIVDLEDEATLQVQSQSQKGGK
jgi:uncharacterized circularly permuted ATP-grasp superfamily protein